MRHMGGCAVRSLFAVCGVVRRTPRPGAEAQTQTDQGRKALSDPIKWPKHDAEMIITHNAHKSDYQTVQEWLGGYGGEGFWISQDEMARAIETDSVWEIHWYPRTPVSFHCVRASTFEAALKAAQEISDAE